MSATDTERREPRVMTLEPATVRALGMDSLTPDLVHEGNVAAHLYRLAYGGGDGLTGINLGWADQEHSTDFLAGIVRDIEEMVSGAEDGDDLEEVWNDYRHEFCDSAVPVYNYPRIMAAMDLQASVSDLGLLDGSGEVDMAQFAGVALYEEAERIGDALVRAIIEARSELAEEVEENADLETDEEIDADDDLSWSGPDAGPSLRAGLGDRHDRDELPGNE